MFESAAKLMAKTPDPLLNERISERVMRTSNEDPSCIATGGGACRVRLTISTARPVGPFGPTPETPYNCGFRRQ